MIVINRLLGTGKIDNIRNGTYYLDPDMLMTALGLDVDYTTGVPEVTMACISEE